MEVRVRVQGSRFKVGTAGASLQGCLKAGKADYSSCSNPLFLRLHDLLSLSSGEFFLVCCKLS